MPNVFNLEFPYETFTLPYTRRGEETLIIPFYTLEDARLKNIRAVKDRWHAIEGDYVQTDNGYITEVIRHDEIVSRNIRATIIKLACGSFHSVQKEIVALNKKFRGFYNSQPRDRDRISENEEKLIRLFVLLGCWDRAEQALKKSKIHNQVNVNDLLAKVIKYKILGNKMDNIIKDEAIKCGLTPKLIFERLAEIIGDKKNPSLSLYAIDRASDIMDLKGRNNLLPPMPMGGYIAGKDNGERETDKLPERDKDKEVKGAEEKADKFIEKEVAELPSGELVNTDDTT